VLEVCGATEGKGSVGDALGVDGVKKVKKLSMVGLGWVELVLPS
jgi:hypothetical protein